jgi:hypothetical protein
VIAVRRLPTLILAICALTGAGTVSAREPKQFPVTLAEGATPLVRNDRVRGDSLVWYRFDARRGQRLDLVLASPQSSWLVVRCFPAEAALGGQDVCNNYITGDTAIAGLIERDGPHVIQVALRRPAARRRQSARYRLTARIAGSAVRAAEGAPSEWIARDACPFECCRYGRWTARDALVLVDLPAPGARSLRPIPVGTAFDALDGEVHTEAGRFRFTRVVGPFVAGDTASVYDYRGEGTYRVWVEGEMKDLDLLVSPYGEDRTGPNGDMVLVPRQEWWVHARVEGSEGWILVPDPKAVSGADDCGK